MKSESNQWRGYGDYAGVCIRTGGAWNQPRFDNYRPLFFGPDQFPFSVKYKWRSKVVTLISIINRFEKQHEMDQRAMPDSWPENHNTNYIDYITNDIEYRIPTFKNNAFSEEKEVRVIVPYSSEKSFEGRLRFRATKFGLIPYLCTGDRKGINGLLPIKEVMIGPSPNKELVAESVGAFLKHNGYEDVEITLSKVPYRN